VHAVAEVVARNCHPLKKVSAMSQPTPAKRQQIEFVGGPFDGFQYEIPVPLFPPATIALPVSQTIQRMLTGEQTGKATPTTSVAAYQLDRTEWRYRFLGAMLPETLRALQE
jgi:hypothetical protein